MGKIMMGNKVLFTTTDPLGRRVSLKNDTWSAHILTKHDEVTVEVIKNNIEKPRYICINVKPEFDGSDKLIVDETRYDYIDLIIGGNARLYALKTIVEFCEPGEGTIVTNYVLRRANEIKTTGGVIYDSQKD
jgi:hypothetical protein